ncbi:hypothetical protein [Ruminiclostridium cellobioparum]|uniref:hypothetical protein n=1 Tax=Ruminiclostridium cellobioparum TaxID=29355 RepID=UPI0028AA6BDD|nr:hypothetical protein [Ruminiclostridium cellobioparum]
MSRWSKSPVMWAAVSGDVNLLKQAALMEIWQMIDEMLIAQEKWLPQYVEGIKAAKESFAKGNLIPTNEGYRGAVRQRVNTPYRKTACGPNAKAHI